MRTLRDSARNYLGKSLANRLKKEEEKQTTKQDTVEAMAACSETDENDRIKRKAKPARKAQRSDKSDYDALLDGIMKKMLADG